MSHRKLQVALLFLLMFFVLPLIFADEQPIIIQINTNKGEYQSGDEIKGEIKLINTRSQEFSDVDVRIQSDLTEEKAFRLNLAPNEEFTVEPLIITAPFLSTSKEKEIIITLTYQDNGQREIIEKKKILILKNENFESLIKVEYQKNSLDASNLKVGVNISLNQEAKEKEALTPEKVKKIKLDLLVGTAAYTLDLSPIEINDLFANGQLQREVLVVLETIEDTIGVNTELTYAINDLSYTKSLAQVVEVIEKEDTATVKVELIKKKNEEALQIKGKREHIIKRIVFVLLGLVILAFLAMSFYMFLKKQRERRLRKLTMQQIKGEQGSKEQGMVGKMKIMFTELEPPKPEQGHDALEHYAAYWVGKGKSKQYVKEKLLKAGWLEEVVDIYLEMIS